MTTLYLKYRPQKISDLDLTDVREMLSKIFSQNDIPHAFLFEGPRGSGKTSAARIIAKILNCEHLSKDNEPCNTCGQCISITKGTNIDVIELDAASHRGIDDIRLIRESVKLAPANAKKKVYIIDEAHMLTTEASNALLKTLEEPPSHVVFILATTNPEKLIDTIKSRTVRIVFKKATTDEIVKSLTHVLQTEKKKYDESVLKLISQNVDGSFRDAKKVLEELLIKDVIDDLEKARNYILNKSNFDINEFFQYLKSKDLENSVRLLNKSELSGVSSKTVIYQIITKLKMMLFSAVGYGKEVANVFDKDEVYDLTDLFLRNWKRYQNDVSEYLPFYLSVVKWCKTFENSGNNKSIINKNEDTMYSGKVKENTSQTEAISDENEDGIESPKTNTVTDKSLSEDTWREILLRVRSKNASTEALLRASRPANFNGQILTLGVYYKFHKEKLESVPHKICLEESLKDVMGSNVKVRCFLSDQNTYSKSPVTADSLQVERNSNYSNGVTENPVVLTDVADSDIEKLADEVFGS